MRFRAVWIGILLLGLAGCKPRNPLDVDVSNIPVRIRIDRFDQKFYGADTSRLPELKRQYPFLFDASVPDSVWKAKMQDTLLLKVKKQVDSVYPDNRFLEKELTGLFKHIKYYFPQFREPRVLTLYSDWDYTRRSYYLDTLDLLFIDNFLGAGNPIYNGMPLYIRQTETPAHLAPAVAESIAENLVPYPKTHTLLNKMIYYGKLLYLQKAFLPRVPDSVLLKYSAEKMKWARENEANVWLYFLDKKLLYSTDPKLDARFLDWAPFSKFYTAVDNQSAGMIGRYLGYRIVSEYMRRTGASLNELIRTDAETVFRQSKYKPD